MYREWLQSLPKVELHFHLEGAIPLDALMSLVEKYGGDPEIRDLEALKAKFKYRDFPHFISTWYWKNQFIREYEDFTHIAEAVGRDLLEQNIRYVEAFFSPKDCERQGLKPQPIAEAIRKGLSNVPEIEVALIVDLVRDYGTDNAMRTLDIINEVKNCGIIGIGIGGSEQSYPPEPFAEVYEKARTMGFRTTVHAGEAAGAESVWGAIRTLRPDRIGHGTRAGEDPKLLDYLAAQGIPLEMCPISNVCTGVVPSIEAHPIVNYLKHGIRVTVNTDDPKMFGNSLVEEFVQLAKKLDFSEDDVRHVTLQAIEDSWMDEEKKKRLRNEFQSDPNWIGSLKEA